MEYKMYEKSMLVYRGRKKNNNSSRLESNVENKTQNLKSIHRNLVEKSKHQPPVKHESSTRYERSSILTTLQMQPGQISSHNNNCDSMHQLKVYGKNDSRNHRSLYRSSKIQLEKKLISEQKKSRQRHNLSVQSLIDTQKHKRKSQRKRITEKSLHQSDKGINFYINIEKLKNLKISSRDKLILQKSNDHEVILQRQSNPCLIKKSNNNLSVDKRSLVLKNSSKNRSISNLNELPFNNRFVSNRKHPSIRPKMRYKTHQNQIDEDQYSGGNVPSNSHGSQYLAQKKSNFRKHELKDRSFIEGYLKGKQLGRGGFSKVWQGFHFSTKQFYAVKQIDTTNKYQTHMTEIWFGNYFFESGKIKSQYERHPGSQKLLKMFEYSIMDPKAFIVYESCDGSLGNMLYDIYEQDILDDEDIDDDQKLYMIKYKHLYGELRRNCNFLKNFIRSIAEALDLLTLNKIVHSDIKTENILIKKSEGDQKYQFKLIDYGSSFVFQSLKQYKLATPEYMCPELLNYILFQNKKPFNEAMIEYVKTYENISAIDVWGLGCIVIELIHGLPLWLNNPTKILIKGNYHTKKGLFAVSDRSFSKILQRQLNIVENFEQFIFKQNNSQICLDQKIKDVLKAMLNPNPKFRIRPHQIIKKLSH